MTEVPEGPLADAAVILGSGLGAVSDPFPVRHTVPFDGVPGLGAAGVEGHRGEFRYADVGRRVCLFARGRRHFYEGDGGAIETLIRCVAQSRARSLLVTFASGSLHRSIAPGELVLADGFLDMQFRPPEPAPSGDPPATSERRGVVPQLDRGLATVLVDAAREARIRLLRGTVATCAGPGYETSSECGLLRSAGADVASMSGVPEVVAAAGLGIRCAALTLVTNWVTGICDVPLRHEVVLSVGPRAQDRIGRLVERFVAECPARRR